MQEKEIYYLKKKTHPNTKTLKIFSFLKNVLLNQPISSSLNYEIKVNSSEK